MVTLNVAELQHYISVKNMSENVLKFVVMFSKISY